MPDDNSVHLHLLPLHDAPVSAEGKPVHVRRRPGRPRKVEKAPSATDLAYHAEVMALRERHVASDPVVGAVTTGTDPRDVLNLLKVEIAREAASLHFERLEVEKRGRDTGQVSTRRIEALKKIAEIELRLKELYPSALDLRGEAVQTVFRLWVERMTSVAEEVLAPESLAMFFNRFATAMVDWESEAEARLR